MSDMNPGTYLGETEVDVKNTPFAEYTPTDWVMEYIERYGQIDGAHHKAWVLDHIARILKGCQVRVVNVEWTNYSVYKFWIADSSDNYHNWVKDMLGTECDGEYEYDYDEGIAPKEQCREDSRLVSGPAPHKGNEMSNDDMLYAPPGTKVTFLNENGYDGDRDYAIKAGLVENGEYTLAWAEIDRSFTDIFLKEFPGKKFNSVMFSCEYDHSYDGWMNDFKNRYF